MDKSYLSESIGKKILDLRKNANMTREELSQYAGVTSLSILKYESGERMISIDTLIKIANFFKVPITYFLSEGTMVNDKTIRIPVVSEVSAGYGKYGREDILDWIEISANIFSHCDFATVVSGDSMEPKIYDSDILLIQETKSLESGDIGIFRVGEEVFCKKFQLNHLTQEVILKSLNKHYDPMYLTKEQLEEFVIIGKVIGKLDVNF